MSYQSDQEVRFSLLELDLPGAARPTPEPERVLKAVERAAEQINAERGTRPVDAAERPVDAAEQINAERGTRPVDAAVATRVARQTARDIDARARAAQAEAEEARRAAAARELVAGAVAEGHGCLVAWQGSGEIRLADLARIAEAHGLVEPEEKSPHLLAARVLRAAAQGRGKVTPVARPRKATWAARWLIATMTADAEAQIGESAGTVDGFAELSPAGELTVTGPLKEQAEEAYKVARQEQILTAGDVTIWLHHVIREQGGVKVGAASYLPAATRQKLVPLISELEKQWGTWLSPTPVATSEQLLDGIRRGLSEEVHALNTKLEAARAAARERGAHDIGAKAGATAHRECMDLVTRIHGWASMIGEIRCAQILRETTELQAKIMQICDGTAARGAMLELD